MYVNMVDVKREASLRESIESLYFGYRAFTAGPDRILAARGLGRVHHRILYFVGRNEDCSVSGLLDVLAVTKQALHAPLRQLMEMGLVESRAAPDDRRRKRLRLTVAGERLEAKLTATQLKLLDEVFAEVGPTAERGWKRAMQRLDK